ncbi:MAG: DUF5107 domain-containing protein [Acidobacteriota bacterium]
MEACALSTRVEHGLEWLRLENDRISVEILPELGAKIFSFVHKLSGTNLLWRNPRLAPARVHYGARFDDNWSGGWDELVPNDLPFPLPNGDVIPDHGEVWSQASEWRVAGQSAAEVTLAFVTPGRVLPTRFEKRVSLRRGESMLRVSYRYQNQGPRPVRFLWNIHPALSVSPASRLDLPARRGFLERWMNEQLEAGLEYCWPYAHDRAGRRVDLRRVPPASDAAADHHYLPDVGEGWYAVTDGERRIGLGMTFPPSVFPHLWLFRALGGWRGLYTLIVEVSNGYPNDLAKAIQDGRCGTLSPGEAVEADVLAIAYAGIGGVERIEPDGRVIARGEE